MNDHAASVRQLSNNEFQSRRLSKSMGLVQHVTPSYYFVDHMVASQHVLLHHHTRQMRNDMRKIILELNLRLSNSSVPSVK